ncbi:Hypothetical protein A7982_09176 [Minicystis rosea]|nr:Hypothetical protein A7982_09176 [Minicystis rosea]
MNQPPRHQSRRLSEPGTAPHRRSTSPAGAPPTTSPERGG